MEPIQSNFLETAHSSMSASHSTAGKHRRQEENSTAVKIACRGKWLIKTKQFRKNGAQNTLSQTWALVGNIICSVLDVSTQSKFILSAFVYFSSGACCASPKREDWLDVQLDNVSHLCPQIFLCWSKRKYSFSPTYEVLPFHVLNLIKIKTLLFIQQ